MLALVCLVLVLVFMFYKTKSTLFLLVIPKETSLENFNFGDFLKNHQDYLSQIITHKYNIKYVQKAYEHFFSPDSNAGKIAVVHD